MQKKKSMKSNFDVIIDEIHKNLEEIIAIHIDKKAKKKNAKTAIIDKLTVAIKSHFESDYINEIKKTEDEYIERIKSINLILEKREKRINSYAVKERKAIKKEKNKFKLAGRIQDAGSDIGLPRLKINFYDANREYEDELGSSITDLLGYFRIEYDYKNFIHLGNKIPEIYIDVLDENGHTIYTHDEIIKPKNDGAKYELIEIDGNKVSINFEVAKKTKESIDSRINKLKVNRRILNHRLSIS